MIAHAQTPDQQPHRGGHAGRKALAGFRALQGGKLLFELPYRRIGNSSVKESLIAGAIAGRESGDLLGRES